MIYTHENDQNKKCRDGMKGWEECLKIVLRIRF